MICSLGGEQALRINTHVKSSLQNDLNKLTQQPRFCSSAGNRQADYTLAAIIFRNDESTDERHGAKLGPARVGASDGASGG